MKNIRYLKRLLVSIYIYLAVFDFIVLINFIITGNEPTTLVASVNAVVGVESIISGIIKLSEQKKTKATSTDGQLQ
ncbi:MAG: hypothetical protein ACYCWE_21850 [Eubacteriales bacterium]